MHTDYPFVTGFVRRPNRQYTSSARAKCKRCWAACKYNFWSLRQPFSNLLLVAVHLLWIAFLILPLLVLVSWFIVSTTVLEPSLTGSHFTITDVFAPNSQRPWWRQTHSEGIMLGFTIFTLIFILIAVFSLVSYYATAVQISGTLKVKKTRGKRVIDIIFWSFILSVSAIYLSYINEVLMWCILGAILNPN